MQYFFLLFGVAATLIFLCLRKPHVTFNVVVIKGIASLGFIFTGLFSFVANPDCTGYFGALVVAGACMGLIGDIALDLKYMYKKEADKFLNTGFISFMVGHVFYVASLIYKYGYNTYVFVFTALCVVCGIGFAFVSEKVAKLDYGKFKAITVIYTAVINSVFGMAFAYAVFNPCAHSIVFTIGLFFFLVSDMILSRTYFSKNKKHHTDRAAIVVNHLTYYIAQFLIAISLFLV